MAAAKNILRSLVVMGLVLGIGLLGLWFLGGNEIKVKNLGSKPTSPGLENSTSQNSETDQFSTVGGKTPQETIGLLTAALEKDDLALAAEYFIPENRESESEELTTLYNANILGDLITALKNIPSGQIMTNGHYLFEVPDQSGGSAAQIELIKNNQGLWKIVSL